MEISGKELAKQVKEELQQEVEKLFQKGITPHLAIITLGDEGAWATYVKQKLKVAQSMGIRATHYNLDKADQHTLLELINKLNADPLTHGTIVQRPLPAYIDKQAIVEAIDTKKDVDGFQEDSLFEVPVFMAVESILEEAAKQQQQTLKDFLQDKTVVVVGKGETAGMPSVRGLQKKYHLDPIVVDRETSEPNITFKHADIIISAVGKSIINPSNIKSGVVLVGIGLRVEEGKAKGDYNNADIKSIASFYTPTPGGIGPLNLAYLFKNLIKATHLHIHG
jgi:methylenetetrahydrofolate dehydrogenase (NADP+)/methenyltetrahydrofolate cyclohydrolase